MSEEVNIVVPVKGREAAIARVSRFLALPPEKSWIVHIKEHRPKRSAEQNRYLWAIYDHIIKQGGEAMAGWSKDDLHEFS